MSWLQGSIVRRLVVVTIVAGLITGLVGVILVRWLQTRELREVAGERNLDVAERTASVIDGRVDALIAQLELLASRPALAGLAPDAEIELAVALRATDELDELILYEASGQAVAAAASATVLRATDLPPDGSIAAGDQRRVDVIHDEDGFPHVEIVVPVEHPPGTVVGSLLGRAPLTLLTHEVESNVLTSSRSAFITAADGTVLAHRELDRVLGAERFPVDPLFSADGRTATVRRDGEVLLVAAARFASLPGWLVVQQAEGIALAPAKTTNDATTIVFLAVIAAIVLAVILAGRGLLQPLGSLAEAVGKLERGQRGVRFESDGVAEVGVLGDAFNRMAHALDDRQAELEAAEMTARRSEERLRLMVEGVEDYAIILLDTVGRTRSWNTGARRLIGYTPDEALGRSLTELFGPEGPDPVSAASTEGRADSEGWCRREDGSRFLARTIVTALYDEDGAPYGYAVVVHDLTDRHAARRALEEALEREQQAAKELRRTNELKDEFLAIAAHEIRTPLSAVLGASNLLSTGWDDFDDVDKVRFRDIIETHAQDMRLIVDRLLDLTRLQAGRAELLPEVFVLDRELEGYLELLDRRLDAHEVVLDAPAIEVSCDRQVLRHVVTNLLSNAAKFSPEGSTITLRGAVEESTLVVAVRDEGRGIPVEDQESVFELFRQSSNGRSPVRGTGVGLAIVKRYVELAGGEVLLDSALGRGSTFTVRIPVPIGTPLPGREHSAS